MNVILVALSVVGLFVFPIVAYGVVWLTSRRGEHRASGATGD